jgi:ABC-type branched-subunit amino acid transport system ATPase component/ABC-type branched-subunit amino acid transport system permease subunit
MKDRHSLQTMLGFVAIYALLATFTTDGYYQLILTMVLVWACFGLSWNLLSGYTGLVSFGHAAFFGLGAYTTALGQMHFGLSPYVLIPLAAIFGGISGLLVGIPTFRLRGHYFALAMLAYPLALLYVFEWLGYQEVTLPMMRDQPLAYMQFEDPRIYTYIALAMLLGGMLLTRKIERTRFGMALLSIKQNEAAAEAAGIDTYSWKLKAITLSGAMAAAVGAFYAIVLLVVTPISVFGMLVSSQALIVTMFGGVGTVWGAVIGSAILIPIAEILHSELGSYLPGIQGVIYGAAVTTVILVAPEGLYWKVRDVLRKRKGKGGTTAPVRDMEVPNRGAPSLASLERSDQQRTAAESGEVILEARGLSKQFGGLMAVDDVSFKVRKGMILGIIGPNGAGKTTAFNLLNGFFEPTAGEVLINGRNMAGLKPHEVCAAGVGRTFQIMRPFMRMSVAENVVVGAFVRASTDEEAYRLAQEAIEKVGLSAIANRIASELTSKELRLMELARALAGQPQLLLLDETLAGLGQSEAEELIVVLKRLAAEDITIVIIEHTMNVMVRLVDRFVVLNHGKVLTEGSPESIIRDKSVVEAYLGKKWSAA